MITAFFEEVYYQCKE